MAVQQGYGKIAGTDALVFAYDTGDTVNSYKGEPVTNDFNFDLFTPSGYGGDGVLQPNALDPFGTTDNPVYRKTGKLRFGPTNGTDVGTLYYGKTYTFSIYLRFVPGQPAFTGGEFDLYDRSDSRNFSGGLGDNMTYEWKRFSVTAFHNNNSNYHFVDIGHYQGEGVFEWTCPQIEENTHMTPFTPHESPRSATEGLLDLTGNETIDLSRTSFDSNADLDFDGTNDEIQIISSNWAQPGEDITVEAIIYREGYSENSGQYSSIINASNDVTGIYSFSFYVSPTSNRLAGWLHSGTDSNSFDSGYVIELNTWYHVAFTLKNGDPHTVKTFVNGVEQSSSTMGEGIRFANITKTTIGAYADRNQYEWNGKIPIVKIYNRALSAAEVQANFNNYKTRFNIA